MKMRRGDSEIAGSVLESLANITAEEIQSSTGMEQAKARKFGETVAAKFAHAEGGAMIYIPRGMAEKRFVRDLEIKAKFNGQNYGELAQAYKITEMRVRQILARKPKK